MSPFREAGTPCLQHQSTGSSANARPNLPDAPPRPGRGATILLADDDALVRALVREVLERQGHHVVEAADGGEALDLCRHYPGPIDLLVTDVVMPKLTGPALVQNAARIRPATRVLYITGYPREEAARLHLDEAKVVRKPFRVVELAQVVEGLLSEARAAG